jgi:hypothetical protein
MLFTRLPRLNIQVTAFSRRRLLIATPLVGMPAGDSSPSVATVSAPSTTTVDSASTTTPTTTQPLYVSPEDAPYAYIALNLSSLINNYMEDAESARPVPTGTCSDEVLIALLAAYDVAVSKVSEERCRVVLSRSQFFTCFPRGGLVRSSEPESA